MALGFVLIKTETGKEREVYDQLLKVPDILELMPLFGEYELISKVEAADFDELGRIILQDIRSQPGVLATKTLTGTKF